MPRPVVSSYRIELLREHTRTAFRCGQEALDRYLKEQATQDARKGVATPYVLVKPPASDILGYYTLSSGSIKLGDLPEAVAKELPRYPLVPVTLLGRLALHEDQHRKGLGEHLLMDALYRCVEVARQIASYAVIVDAIDADAKTFYEHYDFTPFPEQPMRLFLPMKTVTRLF